MTFLVLLRIGSRAKLTYQESLIGDCGRITYGILLYLNFLQTWVITSLSKTLLVSHCLLESQSCLAQSAGWGPYCLFQLSCIPHCLSSGRKACFWLHTCPASPLPQQGPRFSLLVALSSGRHFLREAFLSFPTRPHPSFMLSRPCTFHSTHHSCRFTFTCMIVYEGLFPHLSLSLTKSGPASVSAHSLFYP